MSRTLEGRLVLALLTALLAMHLALTLLDVFGVSWRPVPVTPVQPAGVEAPADTQEKGAQEEARGGATGRLDPASPHLYLGLVSTLALLLAALTQRRAARAESGPMHTASGYPGWGDALALAGGAVVAWIAYHGWSTNPDFFYHWGLKGYRFAVQGGIDYDFLGRPWNQYLHPDYPQLFPELYALTAGVLGAWKEPVLLLWTVAWFAALILAGRAVLRGAEFGQRWGVSRLAQQAGVAILGLGLAMIAVAYKLIGSADLLIALVVVAAMPLFLSTASSRLTPAANLVRARAEAPEVAVITAVSAAAKVEGVVLAALILVAWALARGLWRWSGRWRGWLLAGLAALPATLVVGVWLWQVRSHDLLAQSLLGPPIWSNVPAILEVIWRSLNTEEWQGLGLLLLSLPLLTLVRRVRPLALLLLAQFAFYLTVYVCAQAKPEFYVLSSFPRLMVHMWPATFLALVLCLEQWSAPQSEPQSEPQPERA